MRGWGDLICPNPTDRGKRGVLVEANGGPLAMVIAGAFVHDAKLVAATLAAIVVARPQPTPGEPQHLCLDKAYDNPSGEEAVAVHGYLPHIRRVGEERVDPATGEKRFPAHRLVVERVLLVRYDKHAVNFLGLLQFACALLWFRRLHRLSLLR
jgi:putative transposase